MIRQSAIAALAVLIFDAVVLVPTSAAQSAPSTSHNSVPAGWRTYIFGKVKISIPKDWAEKRGLGCPVPDAAGTLNIGNSISTSCPPPGDTTSVQLWRLPSKTIQPFIQSCLPMTLNGLRVYVGPCGSSNSAGLVYYFIPSLGIEALGRGTGNVNVTGPGTGTVVGRILHTLRKA
jgi:hypothetical protein